MQPKIFLCTILLLGFFGSLTTAADEVASSSERGQQTFMRVGCYLCHGTNGQSNYYAARTLTPNTLSPEAIGQFIRSNSGLMPVYPKEVLSDNEIIDIVAFLKTIPPSPSADSIDILKELKPTK